MPPGEDQANVERFDLNQNQMKMQHNLGALIPVGTTPFITQVHRCPPCRALGTEQKWVVLDPNEGLHTWLRTE